MTSSADRQRGPRTARPVEQRTGRPHPRPAGLRRSPLTFRIAMGLFFVGGLALLAVLVLFASGVRDFPIWLWMLVALAPIGLVVGSFKVRKAGTSLDR